MDAKYYCHSTTGKVVFDLNRDHHKFEPWWAFVMVPGEIINYYSWHLLKWGKPIQKGSLWGPHISIIKGDRERPPKTEKWGQKYPRVLFYYSNIVRWDNGRHAWLDVYSDDINKIRADMGLEPKPRFHITLGRLD
jgi:hypothetical protein